MFLCFSIICFNEVSIETASLYNIVPCMHSTGWIQLKLNRGGENVCLNCPKLDPPLIMNVNSTAALLYSKVHDHLLLLVTSTGTLLTVQKLE